MKSFLAFLAVASMSTTAHASVKICAKFQTDYNDPLVGDFWTSNTNRDARGIWARFTNSDGLILFNGYTDLGGCATVYSYGKSIDALYRSYAQVNGVTIKAEARWKAPPGDPGAETTGGRYYLFEDVAFDGPGIQNVTAVIPPDHLTRQLAVVAFAMARGNAGLSGKTIQIYEDFTTAGGTQGEPDGIADCCGQLENVVASTRRKYWIAHELGHHVWWLLDGTLTPYPQLPPGSSLEVDAHDVSFPAPDECTPLANQDDPGQKGIFTIEYDSTAAREGWASFYSAWIFNNYQTAGCEYPGFAVFDLDMASTLTTDVPDNDWYAPYTNFENHIDGTIFCSGPPTTQPTNPAGVNVAAWLSGTGWLVDIDSNPNAQDCHLTSVENHSVEYDWMRMWWDLSTESWLSHTTWTTQPPLGMTKLAELYTAMGPIDWKLNDAAHPSYQTPLDRLEAAAYAVACPPDPNCTSAVLHRLGHIR